MIPCSLSESGERQAGLYRKKSSHRRVSSVYGHRERRESQRKYSGNIGLYYDLENLMMVVEKIKPGTKTADGRDVVFAFVGAGSVLDKLVLYVKKHHMDNVKFIPYQDKADLIYSLNAGDVHWCVNTKGIKGVSCPSNVYPAKLVA